MATLRGCFFAIFTSCQKTVSGELCDSISHAWEQFLSCLDTSRFVSANFHVFWWSGRSVGTFLAPEWPTLRIGWSLVALENPAVPLLFSDWPTLAQTWPILAPDTPLLAPTQPKTGLLNCCHIHYLHYCHLPCCPFASSSVSRFRFRLPSPVSLTGLKALGCLGTGDMVPQMA